MSGRLARRQRAFERIYQRHVGDVYRYALVVLRNPQDAEDVTRTTFFNAYRSFCAGERPKPALNWLLSIAYEVCRMRGGYPRLDRIAAAGTGPTAADVRRALARLPLEQRAALALRKLEGRSNAEIAEILTITVEAVETLIFRARQALREELEASLTCRQAELAVSRELDGRLSHRGRRLLRRHLRVCNDCELFAGDQEAQRHVLRALARLNVPTTLSSFFGSHSICVQEHKFLAAAASD